MPIIHQRPLEDFAVALLEAGGAQPADARRTATSLVGANLRGYDSHGMMRAPFYINMMKTGALVTGAPFEVLSESDSRIAANANWGFGQVQAGQLLERLMTKAKTSGVAAGTLYHCGHAGRLGEYCEQAAAAGMVAMVMVNSHGAVVRVAPPGGTAPRLSTNPLAIGAPCGDTPLVLDFSTSATAEGKVRVLKIAGKTCPEGWLVDSTGQPTTDPNALYADPPGAILPMGGNQAYKGFGLCLMIDILTGALSGGLTAREKPFDKKGNCVFMLILNPAKFGGAEHFAGEVTQLADYVRSCPTVDGSDIVLPGDPERRILASRTANGIEFDDENWAQLTSMAATLGVTTPPV